MSNILRRINKRDKEHTYREFQKYKKMDVPLERVNILVGGNNSGKTSVLQAIQFGCSITQTLHIIANKKWSKGPKFTRTIDPQEVNVKPSAGR